MHEKICTGCGAELNSYAQKCPDCGSTSFSVTGTAPKFFCVECGKEAPEAATFCPGCGTRIIRPVSGTQEMQQKNLFRPAETVVNPKGNEDLSRKPYFYFVAIISAVLGFWTGSYGFGSITRSYCDQVAFNSNQVYSFTDAFLCVNDFNSPIISEFNLPIYDRTPFALIMIALSFAFWAAVWRYIDKARRAA